MKKPLPHPKKVVLVALVLLFGLHGFAQNLIPFTPRFDDDLKGDIELIGNNNLGPYSNVPFNDLNAGNNSNINMIYVDIDGDPSTFNSSSADLEFPDPDCYEIVHASLYWAAVVSDDPVVNQVRFKGPTGGYVDITGEIIYRDQTTPLNDAYPYACVADVTTMLQSYGTDAEGTYTVGNISTREGVGNQQNNRNGNSAGWSLLVVYEDLTLPSKSITSFDGFSAIFRNIPDVDIIVDGFRTVPAPQPVRANLAFATLEGDVSITGDQMALNGTNLSTTDRPANNFFRSAVTQLDATPVNDRNLNSANTLGFDSGILRVPNPGNSVINNGDTQATMSLRTSSDFFLQYLFAFAVEIIEPRILLTKIVEDEFGNDIGGQPVNLGQELNYVIGFQNIGNDDARNFTIRDVLPINIEFDEADLTLPAGVTHTYNPVARELVFSIEDYLVLQNTPLSEIRIKANVVETCQQLAPVCSNIIENQAFATYYGTLNPDFQITDDPSYSTNTGCLTTPSVTNTLVDLDDCVFEQDEVLCGDSIELTAEPGYVSYSWSTDPSGTPVIGTGQTITVIATGTYYSFNTAAAPCRSIVQQYNVTLYGANITNPIIPYADEVVICPNDGKELPNIYLCGLNDFTELNVDLGQATSIIWEQLDETSCTPVGNSDCANENPSCTWNQIATGPNYTANTAGQFRLTINYPGGCFNQFYFNVYQNLLNPDVEATDIICDSPGSIRVINVPSGYEYSLDGVTYQASNEFTITAAGLYTVHIRQSGLPNPEEACVFTVPDIQIRERDFTVTTNIAQPLCHGDKGSITLAANDAEPQYFYSLYQGATLINSVGPIAPNSHTFSNLNPGFYRAVVETEDGCFFEGDVEIVEPPELTVSAAITEPLTCTDGEITIYPQGGTPPYFYYINSTTVFQTDPVFAVSAPGGTYNIRVVDNNNCEATTTITINQIPAPEFMVTHEDILCAEPGNTGSITFNVSNPNGNSLRYGINGPLGTFSNSPVFTGLSAGTYLAVVEYTVGSSVCFTPAQQVVIDTATPIEGIAELTSPYTCNATGTIEVTGVSGGTPPYEYSIDGVTYQTSPIFTGLTAGTYSVTIRDANDCTFVTNEITIPPLDPPTDLTFSNTPLTCPTNETTVTVTVPAGSGGVAPLEYQIIAPAAAATPYQSSNIFAGLAPGTYTFQVRDANECTYSESYSILPLPTISVVGQNLNDITCVGDDDGSVRFTVSGTTNFVYTINGGLPTAGTSPIILTGLAAGTYTIVVTDNDTNCEATTSVIVAEPNTPLSFTTDVTPISCIDSGRVTITATGGWGGNSYSLELPDATVLGPQGSNIFIGLTQTGTYIVTVEDANGCIVTDTFDLTAPVTPVAEISLASDLCYDTTNGASIEVTVTAGQAPFEFSLNGGPFQSSNVFTGLGPGSYTIIVRDALGCEVTLPTQVIAPELTLSAVLTKDLDCTTNPDAIITGTIGGGTAPFNYAVSFNGGAYTALGATGSPFTYPTGTPGTYQFEVTDAQGCTVESGIITIDPLSLPQLDVVAQSQNILCNGDANGAIDVTFDPSAGTPPFTINVFNNTSGIDYGTQTTGLPAGTYTVTLTDANACSDSDTITLTEPDPIAVNYTSVDITCTPGGTSQGEITITGVSGGTPLYDYYLTGSNGYTGSEIDNDGSASFTFSGLDFGIYELRVIDANGCVELIQNILIASPPSDLDIDIDTTVDCATGGTAVVTVASSLPSAGPFWFDIYNGGVVVPPPGGTWIPETPAGSRSATFTGLIPGVTYTFIVYDESTQCYYYEQSTIPVPTNSTLTVDAVSSNNVTCTGSADGTVTFTVNSTYATAVNVDYEIYESTTTTTTGINGSGVIPAGGSITVTDLGPLPVGSYFVLITETSGSNAGCGVVTAAFNITESQVQLDIDVTVDQNANCNANSGVISALGQDGTPPYQYQMTTTPAAPAPTDPSWGSNNTFNANAGTYYIHVKDAYGCIVTGPATILPEDPAPVIDANVTNQCDTAEGDFEIDVTLVSAGIPPYSISFNGGSFQTQTLPYTITDVSSGTHTIEVNDANGCGNTVSVTIAPPLGLAATATSLPSCSNDDGVITVNANGGTGSYTYSIVPNPPSITLAGNVFSGVPSGTYTITVTDTATGCTEDVAITMEAATPVTFTTNTTDTSCVGSSDGIITVTLAPGNNNPIYTYEIIAPIVVPAQTSNIFTGLPTGTYTVQVTSGRDCIATADATIGEPPVLDASATADAFVCTPDNTPSTVTVIITGLGGTPGYLYSLDNLNYFTNNTFTVIDDGTVQTITAYVQDSNGCIATDTITIDPLETITAASFGIVSPIDCNNTGEIEIIVTPPGGNYTYQMLPDGLPQTSNIFSIPGPGNYYFQVNDLDTNCYYLTNAFEVPPFDLIEATLTPIADNNCFGDAIGEMELDIVGYTGNYTYQLLDGAGNPIGGPITANTSTNPQLITGLAAGNYSVEIIETDSPFCATVSNVVNIDAPNSAVDVVANETAPVTCDNDGGIITAVGSGGTPPYNFQLSGPVNVPFSPVNVFEDLGAGIYTVTVRDAQGCIEIATVSLEQPDPIDADFVANNITLECYGDQDGTIEVINISGGQGGNYLYTLVKSSPDSFTSGPQTNPIFENLSAGVYQVRITDALQCVFESEDVIINQPTEVSPNLIVESTQTCTVDTQLTLSASGGTGPYEYSDNPSFTPILGTFTTSTTFSVTPGTYRYYVRDDNGCIANVTNDITIDPLPDLEIVLNSTNPTINCVGDETGVIVARALGGLGNYVYYLRDSAGNTIRTSIDTPAIFDELAAGSYSVYVESDDCNETSETIEITEPDTALEIDPEIGNVLCFGDRDGWIEFNGIGGTGTIQYAISPRLDQFFVTDRFENLAPGDYDAIIQDELGCFINYSFTIAEPAPILADIVPGSTLPEICVGDADGAFSVEIQGGTPPYSVSLNNYDGPYTAGTPTQTIFDFDNLGGGNHVVYIRDANGCEREQEIEFPDAVLLNPFIDLEYICENNFTGNVVTVTVDDSNTDVSQIDYSLNGGPYQSSNVFENLPPSQDNYILVRHSNGCIVSTEFFNIGQFDPLTLSLSEGGLNEILANTAGGTGGYVYTLNGTDYGSTNSFIISETGEYLVTVTDSSGCTAQALIFLEFIEICIPNYFTPNGDGVVDTWKPGCAEYYPNILTAIFDRYGRKVAELRAGESWDGRYNGSELPTGDYWYVVKLAANSNRDFVGHFTLYR
jgi:gliding motility-associated-like protein